MKYLYAWKVKKVVINFKTVKPYGICSFMYLNFFDFEEDPTIGLKEKEFHIKAMS
mgnify:CR=1 FL=1|jgi:hypothetical protein